MKNGLREIPGPTPTPPRRVPELPLPRTRFVPGLHPHPYKGIGGHAHLLDGPELSAEMALLHGIELYEHHYWWEAHEVWEGLWRTQTGAARDLTQTLILQAAVHLLHHLGRPEAAQRAAARAATLAAQLGPQLEALRTEHNFTPTFRETDASLTGQEQSPD